MDYCPDGDPNTVHYKISNRVSHLLIFYLLVFDRIHDATHLNKTSRTSGRKTGHNIKDPAVYLTVDMGYLLSLFVLNSSGGFAAKKLFFQFHLSIEASAI